MGLFIKTDEEKRIEKENELKLEQEQIKEHEEIILKIKEYYGKVGHIHQGLSSFGLWGVRNNGKIKFKSTNFEIHDNKLLIERNKMIIEYSYIKEIFHENDSEAIILLNNEKGIPIQSPTTLKSDVLRFTAFLNVLNKLVQENKIVNSNNNNQFISGNSEDKFDKLIKLGEMYDKGLLSDEEFASLKNELLSGNTEEPTNAAEANIEISENTCQNCGAEVEEDSKFCAECGTQIK